MELPREILEPHETEQKLGGFVRYLLRRNAGYLCLPLYGTLVYKAWPSMDWYWRYGSITVGIFTFLLSFGLFIWGSIWFSRAKRKWQAKNKEQRERVLTQVNAFENTWIALASVWNNYGAWEKIGSSAPKEVQDHVNSLQEMKKVLLIQHDEYPITGIDAFEQEGLF